MSLVFRRVDSGEPVVRHLTSVLKSKLQAGQKVLWLVPGGSAISVAVEVSKRIQCEAVQNLAVTLTDERYGPEGHADSNWYQLEQAGFSLPDATLVPVLTGGTMDATAANFTARLEGLFQATDYKLGFFGIGPDGHTSGILPNSPAVDEPKFVCAYDGGNYQRITTTPTAISQLDEAVVYAIGEAKWPVFDQLEQELDIHTQPAQALKRVPKVTIFNDHKGEPV